PQIPSHGVIFFSPMTCSPRANASTNSSRPRPPIYDRIAWARERPRQLLARRLYTSGIGPNSDGSRRSKCGNGPNVLSIRSRVLRVGRGADRRAYRVVGVGDRAAEYKGVRTKFANQGQSDFPDRTCFACIHKTV